MREKYKQQAAGLRLAKEMESFKELKEEFRNWLETLGFADSTVKSLPNYIGELLNWLERQEITEARAISKAAIEDFFFQWKQRKNKTRGGGLSQSHINKGILAIHNFTKFLRSTGRSSVKITLEREEAPVKVPEVLTRKEITALYEATYHLETRMNKEAYGQRDRAMLAVYYGCGLRKSEGNNLQVSDILREKELLFVRKGKGNKERYVPMPGKALQDITEYLAYGRGYFLQAGKKGKRLTESFFVNQRGEPLQEYAKRLELLKDLAGIRKEFSLHTLRHSIATHLLQGGMELEQIRKFLGHASLESTQIYTHILNEEGEV